MTDLTQIWDWDFGGEQNSSSSPNIAWGLWFWRWTELIQYSKHYLDFFDYCYLKKKTHHFLHISSQSLLVLQKRAGFYRLVLYIDNAFWPGDPCRLSACLCIFCSLWPFFEASHFVLKTVTRSAWNLFRNYVLVSSFRYVYFIGWGHILAEFIRIERLSTRLRSTVSRLERAEPWNVAPIHDYRSSNWLAIVLN